MVLRYLSRRRRSCPSPRTARTDEQHEHRADDGADDAAEIELVAVADPEQVGEDHPADERAGDADGDSGDEAHGVRTGQQRPSQEPRNDADDDRRDQISDHYLAPVSEVRVDRTYPRMGSISKR